MLYNHFQWVLSLLIYTWTLSNINIFITLIHNSFHIFIMNKNFYAVLICAIDIQLAIISYPVNTC